ncbi:hypothetical protein E2C01_043926 [Portunus trituberculatus]|uniref:Uncharacterized protein n=1 Tax=Portunus trituberculatus TaxID=210409 RepID=A0A5B7G0U2_PORTR|nr:hypothetical protein [Portunus trituberculatus]
MVSFGLYKRGGKKGEREKEENHAYNLPSLLSRAVVWVLLGCWRRVTGIEQLAIIVLAFDSVTRGGEGGVY